DLIDDVVEQATHEQVTRLPFAHPHRTLVEAETGCDQFGLGVRCDDRIEPGIRTRDVEWLGRGGWTVAAHRRRRGRLRGERACRDRSDTQDRENPDATEFHGRILSSSHRAQTRAVSQDKRRDIIALGLALGKAAYGPHQPLEYCLWLRAVTFPRGLDEPRVTEFLSTRAGSLGHAVAAHDDDITRIQNDRLDLVRGVGK